MKLLGLLLVVGFGVVHTSAELQLSGNVLTRNKLCVGVDQVAMGQQLRVATCEARNEHVWQLTPLPETPDAYSWDLAMISDFAVAAQLPSSATSGNGVFLQHRTPHVPNQTWLLPRPGTSNAQFRMTGGYCLTAASSPPRAGDILTLTPCGMPSDLRQQFYLPGAEVPAMPSPRSSGPSGVLSNGSLFLILLSVAIVLYVVGGCVFNHKRHGTSLGSCESCPNRNLWCGFMGLVKDGCLFSGRTVGGWLGCRKGTSAEKERLYDEL